MKRTYLIVSLMVVLFGSVLVLDTYRATLTVQAQVDPNAPAAPLKTYLPLISLSVPTPTPPSRIKSKSGVHLGNRGSDWPAEYFDHLRGTTAGDWPAAVVVMSNQLYAIIRYTRTSPTAECRISGALIKATVAFAYLTDAVHAGTKVVIRMMPSPGNFTDYANPGADHVLSTSIAPAGSDYCDQDDQGRWDFEKFRDYSDIAKEMKSIFDVNTQHGWPADSFFFEPANEPNLEWYAKYGNADLDPKVTDKDAWIDMDNYFAAIYDNAKAMTSTLQILAPPMAQEKSAEHYRLGSCDPQWLEGENGHSGLDFMKQSYGYNFATQQEFAPKADGFSWHNYCSHGQEPWESIPSTAQIMDDLCPVKLSTQTVIGVHVSQYHSAEITKRIAYYATPTFITEADRKSPCQNGYAGSTDGELSKSANAAEISDSLVQFVAAEQFAKYSVAWLLVNEFADVAATCKSADENGNLQSNHNYEQNWHEAYGADDQPRAWFTQWWPVAQ